MAESSRRAQATETSFIELIGPENWEGYKALRACRYDRALAYASVSALSDNEDYRLTSIYLRAAVALDQGDDAAAREIYGEIVSEDHQVASIQQASLYLDEVVLDMRYERRDLGIACP